MGYRFRDEQLLRVALTHPSVAHEQGTGIQHNQPTRATTRARHGPAELESYTRIGSGPAGTSQEEESAIVPGNLEQGEERPAVTLAIAKRKGSNAVRVADQVLERVRSLEQEILPKGVAVQVTRNYGKTANEKVNELVKHLAIAVATIVVLIAFRQKFAQLFHLLQQLG